MLKYEKMFALLYANGWNQYRIRYWVEKHTMPCDIINIYRPIRSAAFVHCYNVTPAILWNGCRMKTNRCSRPVKENSP